MEQILIPHDEYEELLQEKAFREGCEAIIEKLLDRMEAINNACFDYQHDGPYENEQKSAWAAIKKIYDLSLLPERK